MSHKKLEVLNDGFVILKSYEGDLDPSEWEGLRYFDYKSGGDTNFAVLASAAGYKKLAPFFNFLKSGRQFPEHIRKLRILFAELGWKFPAEFAGDV